MPKTSFTDPGAVPDQARVYPTKKKNSVCCVIRTVCVENVKHVNHRNHVIVVYGTDVLVIWIIIVYVESLCWYIYVQFETLDLVLTIYLGLVPNDDERYWSSCSK